MDERTVDSDPVYLLWWTQTPTTGLFSEVVVALGSLGHHRNAVHMSGVTTVLSQSEQHHDRRQRAQAALIAAKLGDEVCNAPTNSRVAHACTHPHVASGDAFLLLFASGDETLVRRSVS